MHGGLDSFVENQYMHHVWIIKQWQDLPATIDWVFPALMWDSGKHVASFGSSRQSNKIKKNKKTGEEKKQQQDFHQLGQTDELNIRKTDRHQTNQGAVSAEDRSKQEVR